MSNYLPFVLLQCVCIYVRMYTVQVGSQRTKHPLCISLSVCVCVCVCVLLAEF